MKWVILGMLLLVGCSEDADYVIVEEEDRCEVEEERWQSNPYTGQGSYGIGLCGGVIEVSLRLKLVGEVDDEIRETYREEIEGRWSTDRFEVPVVFRVIWVEEGEDKTINVINGWGRWNTSQWYTRGDAVAHEVGHYVGLFDEYGGGDAQGFDGGAAPGPRAHHGVGLMQNSNYPTNDYYYDHFFLWLESK